MMTKQEIFDKVVGGLIKQGELSYDSEECCVYRLEHDGKVLRCGIGQLISDELYNPKWEGKPVNNLPTSLLDEIAPNCNMGFLSALQSAHDCNSDLESALVEYKELADREGLDWKFEDA